MSSVGWKRNVARVAQFPRSLIFSGRPAGTSEYPSCENCGGKFPRVSRLTFSPHCDQRGSFGRAPKSVAEYFPRPAFGGFPPQPFVK